MTDAQLLARVWDWADQAVEPIDADSFARAASSPVPLPKAIALRVSGRSVLAPAVSWPAYGFVLLLVLASLLAGALLVGSRQRDVPEQRLPPPFGPARNGVIVVSTGAGSERDLVQIDPVTGNTVTLRSGGWRVDPLFSPDGRQLLFKELVGRFPCCDGVVASLWVMNADGSGARQLVPVGHHGHVVWAPDGNRAFVAREGGLEVIDLANGSSVRHTFGFSFEGISWRPNHDQILLSGDGPAHLVNADGTGLRSLPAEAAWGQWSPDGSTIAYSASNGRVDAQGRPVFRVHILDVDSGIDREVTFDGSAGTGENVEAFSPDGTRLLIFRNSGNYELSCNTVRYCWRSRPIVVPVAGGGPEVVLGSFDAMSVPGEGGGAIFSPDGTQVLGMYGKEPNGVWLYDADSGQETAMTGPPWDSGWWGVSWQRLAP